MFYHVEKKMFWLRRDKYLIITFFVTLFNFLGQITLNGQVIPGLTVNNVTGLSQILPNRAPTPTTPMTPMTPDVHSKLVTSVSL